MLLAGGPLLVQIERWVLRISHMVVLLICFGLGCTADMSDSLGLMSGGLLFLSLQLLSAERQLVISKGQLWRPIRLFAWFALFFTLLFQAPIIPPACATGFSRSEVEGVCYTLALGCLLACWMILAIRWHPGSMVHARDENDRLIQDRQLLH